MQSYCDNSARSHQAITSGFWLLASGFLILAALAQVVFGQTAPRASRETIALTNVTVIDATGVPPRAGMTVIIRGDRIAEIDRAGRLRVPDGARVIDAAGKFLIPGLWDMHVHNSYKEFPTLFIANGITGVRDMGGSTVEFESLQQWRKLISEGSMPGPRIVAAGTHVDGPKEISRAESINTVSAEDARRAVQTLKKLGADFIKVYTMIPREAYFSLAAEAKKEGLSIAGHVPASVSASEASDAGQKSMEHLMGVLYACSSREAQLRSEAAASVAKSGMAVFVQEEIKAQIKSLDTYDPAKAKTLFARFAKNGTRQVPTLVGWRNLADSARADLSNDPRLKYIPDDRKQSWRNQVAGFIKSLGPEYIANKDRLLERQLAIVGAMQRAGVEIMAGTDSAAIYVFPGFSLHDELTLLVRAGLTPMQALQAATRNPARYLGLLDSLGTIEKGKLADLVLLDANPLEDIGNTRKIAAVIAGGRLIDKQQLNEMLAAVEAAYRM
ncbi:MAG TPA: amidohydrolase family protein [Blastocatellia bacterium]|nr:amidohydrolase family protein [Blastocatellia bacterium]